MAKKDEKQDLNLEEVQAQMMAMLEQAKAEAANLVEEAKKSAEAIVAAAKAEKEEAVATAEAKKSEEAKAHEAWLNELVEVKLFKDNGKYKDDVFVAVNGENCIIRRGERVKVKRKFALVLDQSDRQDYETSLLIEQKSNEFARETERRGL